MPRVRSKTRNKFETRLNLKLRKTKKVKATYECVKVPYVIEGKYLADWEVITPSQHYLLEAKGHFRPEAKRKMAAVKRQHPELDIRIVFYSHRASNIRWAEKHGFPWAIGDIPDEWLK